MQQSKMVKAGSVRGRGTTAPKSLHGRNVCRDIPNPGHERSEEELLTIIRSWRPDIRAGLMKFLKEYYLLASEEQQNEFWRGVIPKFRRLNIPAINAMADKLEQLQDVYEKKKAQEQLPLKVEA